MDRIKTRRVVSVILFAAYICVLVYFLFFAEKLGRVHSTRTYSYNLTPLKEIKRFIRYHQVLGAKAVILNLAGNVAAFIPFELFIIPVSGHKFRFVEALVLTFDVSLSVELIQLFTKVGSLDVDDLILNTIGGIIGISLYYLWKMIERKHINGKTQI